ncbi:LysR family transcriptional regulator [Gordonia sp. GN26]
MDIRRLKLLREFADRGSVGAVADAVHMTHSAVSQQLKVLAAEAGVALLEKSGRGVRLTAAGSALVLHADEIIAAMDRAVEEMAAYRSGRVPVRVAMFPSGATLLLSEVLTAADDLGVAVSASHLVVRYPDAPGALADFDLVVTDRDERTEPLALERLVRTELMREPLEVIVDRRSHLAHMGEVTPHDLAGSEWIGVEGGCAVDDGLRSTFAVTGVVPRVTQRMMDFTTIEALVAAGRGVAMLPRSAIRHPGVQAVTVRGIRAARVYEALHRPHPRTAVRAISNVLAEVCAKRTDHGTFLVGVRA